MTSADNTTFKNDIFSTIDTNFNEQTVILKWELSNELIHTQKSIIPNKVTKSEQQTYCNHTNDVNGETISKSESFTEIHEKLTAQKLLVKCAADLRKKCRILEKILNKKVRIYERKIGIISTLKRENTLFKLKKKELKRKHKKELNKISQLLDVIKFKMDYIKMLQFQPYKDIIAILDEKKLDCNF